MADWLTAESLRAASLSVPQHALILGCAAPEVRLLAQELRGAHVTCCNEDAEDLEDAVATATAHGLAIEARAKPPAVATFGLVLVAPRHLHAQPRPVAALQAVAGLLRPRVGVGIVGCDAAVGNFGIGHVRRMLSLLLQPDDPIRTQLQLALSVLQVLPPSSWLRRNLALQRAQEAGALDLTDGSTVYERILAPRPTPELHLTALRRLVRSAGLRPTRLLRAADYAAPRLLRSGGAPRRLCELARVLSWEWRSQLGELLSGEVRTHALVVRRARPHAPAAPRALAAARALEEALGALDAPLDAPPGAAEAARLGGARSAEPAAPRAPPADADAEADVAARAARTRAQYESLPYPPRRPSDEARRLIPSSLASLAQVSHYLYGGRLRRALCGRSAPFRVLVAGGGTGDATVQLAAELATLHARWPGCGFNRSVVVHLDVSSASVALAAARLAARGLLPGRAGGAPPGVRVRLVRGSLLALRGLGLGRFDYINCVGVLHHLPDPAAALRGLAAHALAPGGGLGLMVYGELGRGGVYEAQAALRLLHAAGNASDGGAAHRTAARVADAAALLEALPAAHPLRRNGPVWASHEARGQMGDAGLFDLLLSPVDAPYTAPRLRAHAAAARLRVAGWLTPSLYRPAAWAQPCTGAFAPCAAAPPLPLLRQRLAALPPHAAEEVGELLGGHARKHWAFLVPAHPAGRAAAAPPADAALSPCPYNLSEATLRAVGGERAGRTLGVRTELQGAPLTMTLPPSSAALLSKLDCRRSLAEVKAAVLAEAAAPSGAAFDEQWQQLFDELVGIGALTLTDAFQAAAS